MDENWQHSLYNGDSSSNGKREPAESISVEQLQRLVRLLDHSDVFEIELKRADEGMRLVLRKAQAPDSSVISVAQDSQVALPAASNTGNTELTATAETKHRILAPLVGIFHTWAKPKGRTLVAVGDTVKVGQLVGTIQSLNVINEVETMVAGRVSEILVQEGQPVEYGQHLMTIDSAEGA